jgi:hypothetical protein
MVKHKLQRKGLPCKKFDTDSELCRKNGQNTFNYFYCTLFTVNAENVDDILKDLPEFGTLLPNLSAGYRAAVLNASIKKNRI